MITYTKENIINTTAAKLRSGGFVCQNWHTVIEAYKKPNGEMVYHNTQTDIFFQDKKEAQTKPRFYVIVAGSRGFVKYVLLRDKLDHMLSNISKTHDIVIVSGTAEGADKLGEQYARERGYEVKQFPADWDKYGKSAGYKRNEQMAEIATACVCFWDGVSRGTMHMINIAKEKKLKLLVVEYNRY